MYIRYYTNVNNKTRLKSKHMNNVSYSELLILTLHALDSKGNEIEYFENPTHYLKDCIKYRKEVISDKIQRYKKFFLKSKHLYLFFSDFETYEYYNFKQYINKFIYYLKKQNPDSLNFKTNYIVAVKSLLLLEYFIENFS